MKEYRFKINGKDFNVAVESLKEGKAEVKVNGTAYTVDIESGVKAPRIQPLPRPAVTVRNESPAPKPAPAVSGRTVESPLPGVIISMNVSKGQEVKRGQKIAVLEAMKMENDILAPADGTISEVYVRRGDSVLEGAKIVTIG